MAIVSKVMKKETQLKPSEKFTRMICCIFLKTEMNESGNRMLLNTASINNIKGGQNTQGRILKLKKEVFLAME